MAIAPMNRRALLQSGAVGAGAFAVFGGALAQAAAAAVPAGQLTAPVSVLAWVVLYPEDRAEIRIVQRDGPNRIVHEAEPVVVPAGALGAAGERASAWGQMRAACGRAQDLAIETAARAWDVPADRCTVLPGRIAHLPSGRSVGFGVWADMA